MAVAWRKQMFDAATSEVEEFVRGNPEYVLDADQPAGVRDQLDGGGTNFVLWGRHGCAPVVFKYFHPQWGAPRWRNERACLEHFAATGVVPKVLAVVPETLIVTSCLPGTFIGDEATSGELTRAEVDRLGHELGAAVGKLVNLPLPEDGIGYSIVRDYELLPWNTDLRRAVKFYVDLCRQDQRSKESGVDPFYNESLSLVGSQLGSIARQSRLIYHEDLHCHSYRGKFQGFFDLEMARLGTDLMQLERVFRWCSPNGLSWPNVLAGYQTETGRTVEGEDYTFMLAMAVFYYHIRIVRWGQPDPVVDHIARYLPDLREEALRYVGYVNLDLHLPSLGRPAGK